MTIWFIISAVLSLGVDQLSKLLLYGKNFSVLGDFLWVTSSFNDGAAFGMLSGARWFFIALSVPAICGIIYCVVTKKLGKSNFFGATLGLLLGGIIGNVIDRIALAGVRDFIYLKAIDFAIFNIADACLTIGMIMLGVYILFLYKPDSSRKIADKPNDKNEKQG